MYRKATTPLREVFFFLFLPVRFLATIREWGRRSPVEGLFASDSYRKTLLEPVVSEVSLLVNVLRELTGKEMVFKVSTKGDVIPSSS